MKTPPLLLTGTISPTKDQSNYSSFTLDAEIRLQAYIKAISYYIIFSNFKEIVFCENSNYNLGYYKEFLLQLTKIFNKDLEIIQYNGNKDMVKKRGYNRGEGECMDYAFDNSEIIKKSESFFKITGRYIYYTINNILETTKNMDNLIFRYVYYGSVFETNTRLFKIQNKIYKDYIYDIKKNITINNSIECSVYNALYDKRINFGKINIIPLAEGRDDNPPPIFYKIYFKLGFWNMNNKFLLSIQKLKDHSPKTYEHLLKSIKSIMTILRKVKI